MTVTQLAPPIDIKKRTAPLDLLDIYKIVKAIQRRCVGLPAVDPFRIAEKTVSGIYDGSTSKELDELSIQTAAGLTAEDPQYSRLAARMLSGYIDKEVITQGVFSFPDAIAVGYRQGLIGERLAKFVADNKRKLHLFIETCRTDRFKYFGLRTIYDRSIQT